MPRHRYLLGDRKSDCLVRKGKQTASRFKRIGDILKLREHPKALGTKQCSKERCGRVNSPGYGNNPRDAYNGQSAAKR
jgi:hypothetical protein